MVNINKRLVPIKAHYFFFMAAMGPILPQLFVFGKQIGIAPDVMGMITSVLPILYVIAKPMFGFLADYFPKFRKLIFISLIVAMTLSYGAFYFVPQNIYEKNLNLVGGSGNFTASNVERCSEKFLQHYSLCSTSSMAKCSSTSAENFTTEVLFTNVDNEQMLTLNISNNTPQPYVCHQLAANETLPNIRCQLEKNPPTDCLYNGSTFWLFVIFLFAGTIGFNVINSISDAICFDMLGDAAEHKYGAQRVWGTVGFGLTALLAGVVVNMWTLDAVKSFTPALIIMFIFSGCDVLSAARLKLPKLSSSESIFKDVWGLVKQPAIGVFLIFATIAGIIDSFIIYFMFWHLEKLGEATGHMSQIKLIEGCVVAAECLGEVPFFFYSGKIIKKLGYVHCMSMCFFFYAIRLALISLISNPWYLVGVELFFQGSTYALCYTCIVAYASAVAPPGTSATVQGLMAGMDDGLGFSIGSLIGGLLLDRIGGSSSFMYFAIMAFVTCIAHILIRPTSRKKQYLPKNAYQAAAEQVSLNPIKEEIKS